MRYHIRSLFAAGLAVLAIVLTAPSAIAAIFSVDTTPPRMAVSTTAPSTVTFVWRVVRFPGSLVPNPGTVSSPNGVFLVNGAVVGTVNRTLSRSTPGTTTANETLIYSESVTVPQAVAFRAVKERAQIVYQRTFTDSSGAISPLPASQTGTIDLVPSGPGSEAFSISQLSLSFDDRTRVKVLPKGSRLRAIAELNTSGSGLFRAVWEIALASSTAGTPVFRPLALVRLPVAGGGRRIITSPPLPTGFEGTNLVRLRITEPQTRFDDEPVLQYYVTPESPSAEDQEPRLMLITSPGPGTPLTLTTRFAWQAVPGAQLYKVEVYGTTAGPAEIPSDAEVTTDVPLDPNPDTESVQGLRPLTGAVVPGTQTEIRLQDYSLRHLPGNRHYQWTVKAVGEDGALLGVSPPREIYKP
ncbi:MAG: hypothetical protein GEU89_08235 [Kiloniellaceae bacterium]|nr:hypothetical protein [Kiloniellaceae bacterium]